jgi:hypothetical protein
MCGFFFLLGEVSGSGSYGKAHLLKDGAGFFGKFFRGNVVAVAPCVHPREVPDVGHSPADDAGEVADFFGEPSGSVGHDNEASDLDPGQGP